MDRATLSRIAHRHHPIAAPVSQAQARVLLSRLSAPPDSAVLDLGCGSGVWLAELLDSRQDLTGVGVDIALPPDVAHDRSERITWVEADAARYEAEPVDTVICIGASHAFGGLAPTLPPSGSTSAPAGRCYSVTPSGSAHRRRLRRRRYRRAPTSSPTSPDCSLRPAPPASSRDTGT